MITKSEVEYTSNAFRAHYAGEINTTQKSPVILDLNLRKKLAVQPELLVQPNLSTLTVSDPVPFGLRRGT